MVNFVLVGIDNCEKSAKVLSILMYLQHHLPNFQYTKLIMPLSDWSRYVMSLNRMHNWHVSESPLVYKEVHKRGSDKPILIGGISEFWEYCQEYYNFECLLEGEEVDEVVLEKMKESNIAEVSQNCKPLNIMIYGAAHKMTSFLMMELMEIKELASSYVLRIILYDESALGCDRVIPEIIDDFFEMYGVKATYCTNLRKEMRNVDLLILIDDTSTLKEKENSWALKTYLGQISFLIEEIEFSHNFDLRIIFANEGISSLIATFLANKIKVKPGNVVVVSSDLGVSYIAEISRRSGNKSEKFCAPPVWGSVGLNAFVEAGSTLMKCNVRKPFRRAITAPLNSTLVHGTSVTEFRFIRYFSDDMTDLDEVIGTRRKLVKDKSEFGPVFAKTRALISLIRIWYGATGMKEPIVSIGLPSDGSFGIPDGLVFSQPAILKNECWVPFSQYPISQEVLERVQKLAIEATSYYNEHIALGKRPLGMQVDSNFQK